MIIIEPKRNCNICNRLNLYIKVQRKKFPKWYNNPVKGIGSLESKLLIVGLAPGLKGANKTGIPFTGDFSGELILENLKKFNYLNKGENFNNFMKLRITNAVKCVPPKNKPLSKEINNCQNFLYSEIKNMKNLKIILTLGLIAHKSILKIFKKKQSAFKFKHLSTHQINNELKMINSYHCSKINILTKRLSLAEFEKAFHIVNKELVNL